MIKPELNVLSVPVEDHQGILHTVATWNFPDHDRVWYLCAAGSLGWVDIVHALQGVQPNINARWILSGTTTCLQCLTHPVSLRINKGESR